MEEPVAPYYAGGPQTLVNPYGQQFLALGVAAGTLGVGGYGAIRLMRSAGLRPVDYIYAGVRAVEDFSPGQVFRTFQFGNWLSQFTESAAKPISISVDEIDKLKDTEWFRDLLRRSNYRARDAITYGLQFRDNTLYAGDTVVLKHARVMTSTGEPHLAAAYARISGSKLEDIHDATKMKIPLGPHGEVYYFTGADTRTGALLNQVRAIGSEWIHRANRLASAPFELEPIRTVWSKVTGFSEKYLGFTPRLEVKSGTALQMLGRMGVKWGVLATAAYLGYQSIDWAVQEADIFDATPFAEGITAGVATLGVRANLLAAKVADVIPGLRSFREWQEENAPGSTSLSKLAAFPLVGAIAGATGSWITTLYTRSKFVAEGMNEGLTLGEAIVAAAPRVFEYEEKIARNNFLAAFARKKWGTSKLPFVGELGRTKVYSLFGAAIVGALALPFLPGALIPEKTYEELEKIYSGEQEIPVRKGRWWELGRSPYEGKRIEYFRPHWYPRMLQDARTKSMHGGERPNPIAEWIRQNFTYEPELEHYYDRPYPITGTAFEDIPIVGPLLSATIGRLVKPPKLMHTEEWLGDGASLSRSNLARQNEQLTSESKVLRIQERYGDKPRFELGEAPKGTPVDPYSTQQVLGEQAYRMTELMGLVGFTISAIKKKITGSDEWFDQEERLQSARRMYGAERAYWDMEIGGGLGTTEFFRRLYPHRRRQIPEYNPIRNTMPEWLPGPGDRSPDFLHGDPFVKIKEGEMRLPGEGFAARYPELKGVDPEDYPLVYRYKILSDIAPYSEKTDIVEQQIREMIKRKELTKREIEIFKTAKRQMEEAKKSRTNFYNYEVLRDETDMVVPSLGAAQSRELLAIVNEEIRSKEKRPQGFAKLVRGYWEFIISSAQNPLEAIAPIAPASKLIAMETAIGNYKRTQIYGPEIAFWDSPIEDFIKPFFREFASALGYEQIPKEEKRRRQIAEYFDILEYIKNKRLAESARNIGWWGTARQYFQKAKETTIGVNPYERDYSTLFRAIPKSERDYFNAFVKARTAKERQEILEMVPANLRRIYEAQWELRYADTLRNLMKKGAIPEELHERAWQEISTVFAKRKSAGFPINEELIARYQEERKEYEEGRYESYADWYRRAVLIPEALEDTGLPGPDWVGWHPGVDLQDIKLRVIKNEGFDIHDFDLWESDEREAAHRPYVDEAVEQLEQTQLEASDKSPEEVRAEIKAILDELGIAGQVNVFALKSDKLQYSFEIEASEDRTAELRQVIKQRLERVG